MIKDTHKIVAFLACCMGGLVWWMIEILYNFGLFCLLKVFVKPREREAWNG